MIRNISNTKTELLDGLEYIEEIMQINGFLPEYGKIEKPTICVVRNTEFTKEGPQFVEDTGSNNCDSILLMGEQTLLLRGRSLPHDKYIKKMLEGKARCNYIASQYCKEAWQRGLHRGHEAAVQNRKFVIFRTEDYDLKDEDDYSQYDIVSDNFHAWAPSSAGCVTVRGNMAPPTEDWIAAHEYLYETHANAAYFDALILEHQDTKLGSIFRVGSFGQSVEEMQKLLARHYRIKADGYFGPYTHEIVLKFQKNAKLTATGQVDEDTWYALQGA